MFIDQSKRGYTRDGEQWASGRFLVLVQPDNPSTGKEPIKALVRHTSLRQCGHFMMGECRAFGHRITLSGAYGNDGLVTTVPAAVYEKAVLLPAELIAAWSKGGGWNSAGSEGPEMREWARKTFPTSKPA
jgi:hypothetical protein